MVSINGYGITVTRDLTRVLEHVCTQNSEEKNFIQSIGRMTQKVKRNMNSICKNLCRYGVKKTRNNY